MVQQYTCMPKEMLKTHFKVKQMHSQIGFFLQRSLFKVMATCTAHTPVQSIVTWQLFSMSTESQSNKKLLKFMFDIQHLYNQVTKYGCFRSWGSVIFIRRQPHNHYHCCNNQQYIYRTPGWLLCPNLNDVSLLRQLQTCSSVFVSLHVNRVSFVKIVRFLCDEGIVCSPARLG